MNKRKNYLVVFSFLVVLAGTLVFSGCETSRVGPEVPRPNPAPPAAQAVVLSGYVLDGGSGNGISGANVNLTKLDGTVVSTSTTNSSGLYSFDLTALNVADATLNVNTNVTGYGYGFRVATYDKANGTTAVTPIVLTKIAQVVTVTVTPASGGTASVPPSTDAKTSTPVTVTVPANAVPTNTQVTVATVPVVSTPPPTTASATQNIVSSNNLSAPGVTTFSQPITMTFNLPFGLPAGTQIPLLLLNATTNKWENTGLNAVVAAGGLTASVQVTKPGQYALLGNLSVSQTASGKMVSDDNSISITKTQKVTDIAADYVVELTPSNRTYLFTGQADAPPYNVDISGFDFPNNSFTYGLIQQRFGITLLSTSLARFNLNLTYNLPATLKGSDGTSFSTVSGGVVIGPPGHTTESGDWIYRVNITQLSVQDIFSIIQSGVFNRNVIRPFNRYTYAAEWVWRAHNQGGTGLGGYNP